MAPLQQQTRNHHPYPSLDTRHTKLHGLCTVGSAAMRCNGCTDCCTHANPEQRLASTVRLYVALEPLHLKK